ncbi:hypothetical protein [Hafnia paralvei]|uniref:hypothetical protein n=1 Tax=Hafnia paralvei TaxID=546367 RepID=UPI0038D20F03
MFMNYREAIERTDAIEYLIKHFPEFPSSVPNGGPTKEISVSYFKQFRFVLTHDGEVIFGDCMVPGITADDFNEYKHSVLQLAGDSHDKS